MGSIPITGFFVYEGASPFELPLFICGETFPLSAPLSLYEWIGQVRNNSTRYTRRKYLCRVFLTCPIHSYRGVVRRGELQAEIGQASSLAMFYRSAEVWHAVGMANASRVQNKHRLCNKAHITRICLLVSFRFLLY